MKQDISFTELFNLNEIQAIQDAFALSSNVSSIITEPDGKPITRPSSFCRLCKDIIRKNPTGRINCMKSDAVIGKQNLTGPIIQPCLSSGLWVGGTSINVGKKHVANWIVGQVRNEEQNDEDMLRYADEIGIDRETFKTALEEVPQMSGEQFKNVCRSLFLFARLLSRQAFQNLQLKESEDRFSGLLERLDEAVFRISLPDGKYEYFSPAAESVFGYPAQKFMNNPFWLKQIIHLDFMNSFDLWRTQMLQGEVPSPSEYKILDPDGKEQWIFQTYTGVSDESGKIIAIEGSCVNITARKEAEKAQELLVNRLNRLTAITENTSDLVTMSDLQGNITYVNSAGLEMVGRSDADPVSLKISDFHPPEITKEIGEKHLPVVMEKGVFSWETVVQHKNGKTIPVSQVITLIKNNAGEPESFGTIMRDMSDIRGTEQKLRANEVKYKRLAENLKQEIIEREKAEQEIIRLNQELEQRIKEKEGKYLIFMLADEAYGINIRKIKEIITMMPVIAVPNKPDFITGVINLRGKIVPVADLRRKLGIASSDYGTRTCIIIAEIERKSDDAENISALLGIMVDSVSEVSDLKGNDIADAPEFGKDLNPDYIIGVTRAKDNIKILINIDKLFKPEEIGKTDVGTQESG